jgi:flap endonuclease-1
MGIRNLNRHLRDNCPESIRAINIADLSGKRIAIDISIYLYKYETDNALLENMYVMLSIFRYYNIIPIFVFDGKPPPEKKALLEKRKEDREEAQEEYKRLQNQLANDDLNENEKQDLIASLDQLKKQIVQINKSKIDTVKSLIRAYGATYYDAPGEADELCALLVIKKKVWACLSEDMDMFVYGCTRVLRYFSLMNHTAVLYYMKGILEELNMTQEEFREVCVLSGTDYNTNANGNNDNKGLQQTIKLFKKFKSIDQELSFCDWLIQTTDYVSDKALLEKINIPKKF